MDKNNCTSSHHSKTKGTLFGLLLVMAGLLFLSFNFGWIDNALKPVIFSWPMIFVVIGIIGFSKRNYFFSLLCILFGFFFLLPRIAAVYPDSFHGIDADFSHTFWPLLLIILGIGFIFKVTIVKHRKWGRGKYDFRMEVNVDKDKTDETSNTNGNAEEGSGRIEKKVVFGGSESIFLDPFLYGGDIEAIFGGVVLDLRRTQLPEGVTYLDVQAIFGGVEIYVPSEWLVEPRFQTMMGGFHDQRVILNTDKTRKLVLQGDLIFGGCNIR